MAERQPTDSTPRVDPQVARTILFAFLLTFIAARVVVFLIMSRRIPDLYLYIGGTHIHHLNYGIFLLSAVGGYLLLAKPKTQKRNLVAMLYGVGMGLTFDEFGMWVRLGGSYWQRASLDAIGVLTAIFGLIAFAPALREFKPRHVGVTIGIGLIVGLFFIMLVESFHYAQRVITPRLYQLEINAPNRQPVPNSP